MTIDQVNDPSKANPGRNDTASDAPSTPLDSDVSAETSPRTPQQQRIEAQRAQLPQAHGVLRCLYEVLLHAECDDAVFYAEAAYVAANLVNNSVEELDSVRLNAA
jgi:hypothetical protein